jgi:hypothetical protein
MGVKREMNLDEGHVLVDNCGELSVIGDSIE